MGSQTDELHQECNGNDLDANCTYLTLHIAVCKPFTKCVKMFFETQAI